MKNQKNILEQDTAVWCSQEEIDVGRADYSAEKGARYNNYYKYHRNLYF